MNQLVAWLSNQFLLVKEQGIWVRILLLARKVSFLLGKVIISFLKSRPALWKRLVIASRRVGVYEQLQYLVSSESDLSHHIMNINTYDQLTESGRDAHAALIHAIKNSTSELK